MSMSVGSMTFLDWMISNCYTSAELYQLHNRRYYRKLHSDIAGKLHASADVSASNTNIVASNG